MNHLDNNSERKLWGAILAVKELYPFKDKWNNEILPNFIHIINEYKNDIDFLHIGFPKKWKDYWKITGLLCDYKNCNSFNPTYCSGLCPAKNTVLQHILNKK